MSEGVYPRRSKTLRRRHLQKGGAGPFPGIFIERKGEWQTYGESLQKDVDFNFLISDEKMGTSLSAEEYIKVVENQDKLFEYALDAIYKRLGIEILNYTNESAIIDAFKRKKEENTIDIWENNLIKFKQFIIDIYKMIRFGENPIRETKISNCVATEMSFLETLINPARLRNLLIHDLAQICIAQKKDISILNPGFNKEDILKARGSRYESVIRANAFALSSQSSCDGFFVSNNINNFKTIIGFGISTPSKNFITQFISNCNDSTTTVDKNFNYETERFAFISAIIFKKMDQNYRINIHDVEGEIVKTLSTKNRTKPLHPTEIFLNKEALFKVIDLNQYQFVVHLCAKINELAKKEKEPAPPAPPPAPPPNPPAPNPPAPAPYNPFNTPT